MITPRYLLIRLDHKSSNLSCLFVCLDFNCLTSMLGHMSTGPNLWRSGLKASAFGSHDPGLYPRMKTSLHIYIQLKNFLLKIIKTPTSKRFFFKLVEIRKELNKT